MDIPINLVFKVKLGKSSKIMIGGGPYVAFLYNGREKKKPIIRMAVFKPTKTEIWKLVLQMVNITTLTME